MRTSLGDIKLIEQFLAKTLPKEENGLVEKRMVADPEFQLNVFLQRKINQLLQLYFKQKFKSELRRYHNSLFRDPLKKEYTEKIFSLFNTRS
jgi:hypothetical protein